MMTNDGINKVIILMYYYNNNIKDLTVSLYVESVRDNVPSQGMSTLELLSTKKLLVEV